MISNSNTPSTALKPVPVLEQLPAIDIKHVKKPFKKDLTQIAKELESELTNLNFLAAIDLIKKAVENDFPSKIINEELLQKLIKKLKQCAVESISLDTLLKPFSELAEQLLAKKYIFTINCVNVLMQFNSRNEKVLLLHQHCLELIKAKFIKAFELHISKNTLTHLLSSLEKSSEWSGLLLEASNGVITGNSVEKLLEKIVLFIPDSKLDGLLPTIKTRDLNEKLDAIIETTKRHIQEIQNKDAKELIPSDQKTLPVKNPQLTRDPYQYLSAASLVVSKLKKVDIGREAKLTAYMTAIANMPDNIYLYNQLYEIILDTDKLMFPEGEKEIFRFSFARLREIIKPRVPFDRAGVELLLNGVEKLLSKQFAHALVDFSKAQLILKEDPLTHALQSIVHAFLNQVDQAEKAVMMALEYSNLDYYYAAHYLLVSLYFKKEVTKDSLFLYPHLLSALAKKVLFDEISLNEEIAKMETFLREDRKKGSPVAMVVSDSFVKAASKLSETNPLKAEIIYSKAILICSNNVSAWIARADFKRLMAKRFFNRPSTSIDEALLFKQRGTQYLSEATKDLMRAEVILTEKLTINPLDLTYLRMRSQFLLVRFQLAEMQMLTKEVNRLEYEIKANEAKIQVVFQKEVKSELGEAKIKVTKKLTPKQLRNQKLIAAREVAQCAQIEKEKEERRAEAERKKIAKETQQKAEAAAFAAKKAAEEALAKQAAEDTQRNKEKLERTKKQKEENERKKRQARLARKMSNQERLKKAAEEKQAEENNSIIQTCMGDMLRQLEIAEKQDQKNHSAVQNCMADMLKKLEAPEQEEASVKREVSEKLRQVNYGIVKGQENMTKQILEICQKEIERQKQLDLKFDKQKRINAAHRAEVLESLATKDEKQTSKKVVTMKHRPVPTRVIDSIPKQVEAYAEFLLALQEKTGHTYYLTGGSAFALARHLFLKEKDSKLTDEKLDFYDYDTFTSASLADTQLGLTDKTQFERYASPLRKMLANENLTAEHYTLAAQEQEKLKNPKCPEREFSNLFFLSKNDGINIYPHISFCHYPRVLEGGLIQDAWLRDFPINAFYWEFFRGKDGGVKATLYDGTGLGLEHASGEEVRVEMFAENGTAIKNKLLDDPIQIIRLLYKTAQLGVVASRHDRGSIFNLVRARSDIFQEHNIALKELQSWVRKIFKEFFPLTDNLEFALKKQNQFCELISGLTQLGIMRVFPAPIARSLTNRFKNRKNFLPKPYAPVIGVAPQFSPMQTFNVFSQGDNPSPSGGSSSDSNRSNSPISTPPSSNASPSPSTTPTLVIPTIKPAPQ